MFRMRAMGWRDLRNGLLFVSPWFVGFVLFIAYPLGTSLYYSMTSYNIMRAPHWVALANYRDLILHDTLFVVSLYNTLYFIGLALPVSTVFSLAAAMLLHTRMPGIAIFRTIFYVPSVVPAVASSIIWLMLLNPQFGVLNSMIRLVGLRAPGWLADPAWAKPALVMMSVWGLGGAMVIYLAALQDVPEHLIEAAILDGANAWDRFLHVTVPMISPAVLFNVVVGLIGGFQVFTTSYVMTGGGPLDSTLFYALYLYRNAFQYLKMGYASAQAWLLLIITMVCTILVLRSSARRVYYGGE